MLRVEARIKCYEVEDNRELILRSHWNENGIMGKVVITTPRGEEIVVFAQDLRKAVDCCIALK